MEAKNKKVITYVILAIVIGYGLMWLFKNRNLFPRDTKSAYNPYKADCSKILISINLIKKKIGAIEALTFPTLQDIVDLKYLRAQLALLQNKYNSCITGLK